MNVLGVGISAIHLAQAADLIFDAVRDGARGYITVTGVHGVMEAQRDPSLRAIFNEAWMVTPDGMPMVWVGRLQGYRGMSRVYGPDLMLEIFGHARNREVRHFFYGGAEGIAVRLRDALQARFPEACVCGTFAPPFRPLTSEERDDLIEAVRAARPDIVWVGISTPKQERFMAETARLLDCKLMIGVGAAFDIHAGVLRQAPRWMRSSGLEWLFRLGQEPRRLWKRYLLNNPRFVWRILKQLFTGRSGAL